MMLTIKFIFDYKILYIIMICMRGLFLAFLLVLPMTVFAKTTISESFYKNDIEKCDKQFEQNISKNGSNFSMADASDLQIVCYEKVANKIIDTSYTKQSDDMKNDLRNAITAFHRVSKQMHNPDKCYGQCGSIAALSSYSSTLEFMKLYIKELVSSANTDW